MSREPTDAEREDARHEELERRPLPLATRRCADCGIPIWGVCVCALPDDYEECE